MIEVFITNVDHNGHADELAGVLLRHFPGSRVNFDLDDCDRVLRIEGDNIHCGKVVDLVNQHGFDCSVME